MCYIVQSYWKYLKGTMNEFLNVNIYSEEGLENYIKWFNDNALCSGKIVAIFKIKLKH